MMRALFSLALLALSIRAFGDVPGTVRLPLDRYDALLAATQAETEGESIAPSVRQASYRLAIERDFTRLETVLDVVRVGPRRERLPLPDVGAIFAFEVESGAARLVREPDGRFALDLPRIGPSRVRLRSSPTRTANGVVSEVTWTLPDASAAELTASLPAGYSGLPLEIGEGRWESSTNGGQRLRATLARKTAARVRFSTGEIARAPEEPLLAMIAEARLVELDVDRHRMVARLSIDVLRGRLNELPLELPNGLELIGAEVSNRAVTAIEGDGALRSVRVEPPAEVGKLEMFVVLAGSLPETGDWTVPELAYPGLVKSESWLAIAARRPLLLDARFATGWDRVDESDLPDSLRAATGSMVLWAGRKSESEARLAVAVSRFPDAEALEGVVHRASALSLVGEDGRRVDRLTLSLETRSPLLRYPIPDEAEVWSLRLDGKAVRPFREDNELLVALGRGQSALQVRHLELVLAREPESSIPRKGRVELAALPAPFPVTHLEWDVLLPEQADYRLAGGSVERREWRGDSGTPVAAARGWSGYRPPTGYGLVRGRVFDDDNALLPGVLVTLSGESLIGTRSVTTDSAGSFVFSDAPAGRIALEASLDGFNAARVETTLEVDTQLTQNLELRLASEQVEVTVVAGAPIVDLSSTETGMTITGEMLDALAIGRNFTSVVSIRGRDVQEPESETAHPTPPPLTDSEREALLSHREAGVTGVSVSLPEGGKRLALTTELLEPGEAAQVTLDVRPHRGHWWD